MGDDGRTVGFRQMKDGTAEDYALLGRLGKPYLAGTADRDLGVESVVLDCLLEAAGRETVEIVQIRYELLRVDEVCTDDSRQVTNRYWVEDDTGFVWKSEQWLGPALGRYTIEILRPYDG